MRTFQPSLIEAILVSIGISLIGNLALGQAPDVKLPPGFTIQRIADDSLATNIFSLTISPEGDPVVSGPGYIKRLVDKSGGGQLDRAVLLSSHLKSGAQGMCFDGEHLLAVGDGGLWRIDLTDSDRAPKKLFSLKTGGEHDSHAIRKGPFGYWYLIAGNGVTAGKEFYNDVNSPVKNPRAGFLMRFSPDWKQRAIIAHGFRNAYDFDFNRAGEIFVYDSDGERDVSLPWYRPIRVFQIRPGDDAGWVTASWKRPSQFLDMPEELGAAGRGSPTGVCVFNGSGLGEEFDQAVFAADWTFGRIIVFRKDAETGIYDQGNDFALAQGDFGFAVTDIEQGVDGDLIVTVGGRGTQGGVYRISSVEESPLGTAVQSNDINFGDFENRSLPSGEWKGSDVDRLIEQLESRDLQCLALDSLVGRTQFPFVSDEQKNRFEEVLRALVTKPSNDNQKQLLRVLTTISKDEFPSLFAGNSPMVQVKRLSNSSATVAKRWEAVEACLNSLKSLPVRESRFDGGKQIWLVRLAQLAAGDCKKTKFPAVFDGYSCRLEAGEKEDASSIEVGKLVAACFPIVDSASQREFGRLAAMLRLGNNEIKLQLSKRLTLDSDPIEDIHWLICLAKQQGYFPPLVEQRIADALLRLEEKITSRDLPRDRNWIPRMRDLCSELMKRPQLRKTIVCSTGFGKAGHRFIYLSLPREDRAFAVQKFLNQINDADGSVSADQLDVLVSRPDNVPKSLFRELAKSEEFRLTATLGLTHHPEELDNGLFTQALTSGNHNLIRRSVSALAKTIDLSAVEVSLNALAAIRKLRWEKRSIAVRDDLIGLLRQIHNRQFGFELNSEQNQAVAVAEWEDFLAKKYPVDFQKRFSSRRVANFESRFALVNWDRGDPEKGRLLYQKLQCANCHDGGSRLGPKLEGVSKRFAKRDLFMSIVRPNEQVAERYRALVVQTIDGQIYRGASIYDSVDGITLLEASGETIRINKDDIDEKSLSEYSLMPKGLLDEATQQDLADLYAYLKSR